MVSSQLYKSYKILPAEEAELEEIVWVDAPS